MLIVHYIFPSASDVHKVNLYLYGLRVFENVTFSVQIKLTPPIPSQNEGQLPNEFRRAISALWVAKLSITM